jgi:hypothetical protein
MIGQSLYLFEVHSAVIEPRLAVADFLFVLCSSLAFLCSLLLALFLHCLCASCIALPCFLLCFVFSTSLVSCLASSPALVSSFCSLFALLVFLDLIFFCSIRSLQCLCFFFLSSRALIVGASFHSLLVSLLVCFFSLF